MKTSRLICVGVFLGAHGVRGQVRVASLTEDPEDLFTYQPLMDAEGKKIFELTQCGISRDAFLASVKGIEDRDAAQALKGTELFVSRESLPEDDEDGFYCADLIGLTAKDSAGKVHGLVQDVHDYGAGTFLEIKPSKGASFMLPFKDAFVPVVDVEAGFIEVDIPNGWLSQDKQEPKPKQKKGKSKQ